MSAGYAFKQMVKTHGVEATKNTLIESVQSGKLPRARLNVLLPDLARQFLGDNSYLAERNFKAAVAGRFDLMEAGVAQDASAFSNITGQLLVTEIKAKYDSPDFIASKLVRTVPNPAGNLRDHTIPMLSDVLDEGTKLQAMEEYPLTTFGENWVTMPAPERRGQICAVDFGMLYTDLTGQAMDSAGSVGRAIGYGKEKRVLSVVLGLSGSFFYRGVSATTYVTTAGAPGYVNKIASNTILNYTHINSIEQLFARMTDPITSRLIEVNPTAILCMPEKRYELKNVLNALSNRSGNTTTDTSNQVEASNPLDTIYPVHSSKIARALLAAAGWTDANIKEAVYLADFGRAFGYREVYPLSTEIAPPNNLLEFKQDIVLAVKAKEFGVPFVYDARYAAQSLLA